MDSIRERRVQYETAGLDRGDLLGDPVQQWHRWYFEAEEAGCVEPNAMALTTVDSDGVPDCRYVLTRGVTDDGFDFYTNYQSAKSQQMQTSGHAAGLFTWLQLHRQLRIRGTVQRVPDAVSDEYFASRPRASQIGAWASPQSMVLRDRAELEQLVDDTTRRFGDQDIPRPPHWGGWRIQPTEVEVWQGRPSRLHDRFRYRRTESGWLLDRLAP